ncbi:MAG: GxxExxY protein [Phycisphaerales bacterium]|nr:GxxExxY protein [Phycisphaerales bacterium]
MEVHRELGCGFLEAVYHEALAAELDARSIPYRQEVDIPVFYKAQRLNCGYRADFVAHEDVLLELKALKQIGGVDEAQIIHYLKATGMGRGLLLNFGAPSLEFKRFVLTQRRVHPPDDDGRLEPG